MATTFDLTAAPASGTTTLATVRFRRIVGAVALPTAFVLQLVTNTTYAWASTQSGLVDTESSAEALELFGRYPGAVVLASCAAMVGVLVMIPGLLAALRVLGPGAPRLALVAVTLMIAGYVCYFGMVMTGFDTLALAEFAIAHPQIDAAAVLDAMQSPVLLPFFLLFVIGNLLGTLLLGIAVIRSRAVPRLAGVLVMCWTLGHIVNILGGGEWFAVAGGTLEIIGLGILATAALRMTDAQWAARG